MVPEKIDTLVIIGNGFDIWQNLNTSYFKFKEYYIAHRDEILRDLGIERIEVIQDGVKRYLTPVEMIYGDPFRPDELESDFWKTFEASLSKIDAQRINLFFDKEDEDIELMREIADAARRILNKAFNDWVGTLDVREDEAFLQLMKEKGLEDFRFGSNCFFINFNYTETLEKRFHVDEDMVYHIHGQHEDEEVIFGHAEHPQQPQHALQQFGGRFGGLYNIETILYETDKHVQSQIMDLRFNLFLGMVNAADIKKIYVLGHSLGDADLEYFDFLIDSTSADRGTCYKDFFKDRIYYDYREWDEKKLRKLLKKGDSMDELHHRLQYTMKRYGYRVTGRGYQDYGYQYEEDILPEEIAAVNKLYGMEQTATNMDLEKEFVTMLREELGESIGRRRGLFHGLLRGIAGKKHTEMPVRKEDAEWHISCFSDADVNWAEKVMSGLGCKNYKIHRTIDECLKSMA